MFSQCKRLFSPSIWNNAVYMSPMAIAKLDRSLISITGDGAAEWLSGLITNSLDNDINFAALLTPQGKIIADFFVIKDGDALIIDTADKFAEGLKKRLSMYRMRAPIVFEDDPRCVYAAWDGKGDEGLEDPRHEGLGRRILADYMETQNSPEDYNSHRLSLGIVDSQWDFGTAETFPANANMDLLSGVNFKKGCFIGQEVVSRMYRMTEVKKRMRAFSFEGTAEGTDIKLGERSVGAVMHVHGNLGMAMMRLGRLANSDDPLMIGETVIQLIETTNGHQA